MATAFGLAVQALSCTGAIEISLTQANDELVRTPVNIMTLFIMRARIHVHVGSVHVKKVVISSS